MTVTVHVIPVDATLTAEEAWWEIRTFGYRVTDSGLGEYWAVVRDEDDDDA